MATTTDWILEVGRRSKEWDLRADQALGGLSWEQLNWRPDKETWSIAQQFQHMVLANRSYVEVMESLGASAGPASDEYKPGFWGRFLIKAVGPEESVPSPVPRPLIPSEEPLDGSIRTEFFELQSRYHNALEMLAGKDMNARFSSPFAKLIKLKLGDAVQILERHNERHLGKAIKLLEHPGFPR